MSGSKRNRINPDLAMAFKGTKAGALYRNQNTQVYDTLSTKMVHGRETDAAIEDDNVPVTGMEDPYLKGAMAQSIERIRDSNNILQLLPDIKLSIEIIIGGILSPKDLMNTALTFSSSSDIFKDKGGAMLNKVEEYFTTSYKLKDELPKMLWDILAYTGSYPLAVLPETSVDYIINSNSRVTMESLQQTLYTPKGDIQPVGLVAPRASAGTTNNEMSAFDLLNNISTENYSLLPQKNVDADYSIGEECFNLSLTDNPDVLKIPSITRRVSTQFQQTAIDNRRELLSKYANNTGREIFYSKEALISCESLQIQNVDTDRDKKEIEALRSLYPKRDFKASPILKVKPRSVLEKPTFGHPLVQKLPTEAVIPIYSPNDPSDHLGYLVALDNNGIALRMSELENIYRSISSTANASFNTSGASSWVLQRVANQAATDSNMSAVNQQAFLAMDRAAPVYRQMVESDLLDRLTRGSLGSGISLGKNDTIWELMLARALAGKRTQLLYLPASLLAYIATDHDSFGLGKTLLDDSKTLAALRTLQLFVNSMASTKNAITKRVLHANLSKHEKNPQKALEMIQHEFIKGTRFEYPISTFPIDSVNYLQMAGVQVQVDDHPRLPNTQISVDYLDNQYRKIDVDFDEYLKKLHSMAVGLPPSVVDDANGTDFATQAIFNNVVTARRIKILSDKFCASLSNFVRLYVYNSQILMDELKEIVKTEGLRFRDQFGTLLTEEEVVAHFLMSVEVSLPLPDLTSVKEQKESFEEMVAFYELAIDQFINEEMFTGDELGTLGENGIAGIKAYIQRMYTRSWMRKNGILPELFDLTVKDRDGRPLMDVMEDRNEYLDSIGVSILEGAKGNYRRVDKLNKAVEKAKKGKNLDGEGSGGGFDGGGAEFGGDPEFDTGTGLDEEIPGAEVETEVTVEEEPKPDEESNVKPG